MRTRLLAFGAVIAVCVVMVRIAFDVAAPRPPVGPGVEPLCVETIQLSAPALSWVAARYEDQVRRRPIRTFGELPRHYREPVRLEGFLHTESHWIALYSSRAAVEERRHALGLALHSLWPGEHLWRSRIASIADRCVAVEGIYSGSPAGQFGRFDGTIGEVLRLEVWLTPYRPFITPALPPPPPLISIQTRPDGNTEANVYAALFTLTALGHGGIPLSKLLVFDMRLPMNTLTGSSPNWLREFDDVPAALRAAASSRSPATMRLFDRRLLPARTRWISQRAIDRTLRGDPSNWPLFKRRQGAAGWVSFSDVLFSPDTRDALVFYRVHVGGHGEAAYVWLHRETASGDWSVRKRIISGMG